MPFTCIKLTAMGREGRGDYNEITMRVGEITSNWARLSDF